MNRQTIYYVHTPKLLLKFHENPNICFEIHLFDFLRGFIENTNVRSNIGEENGLVNHLLRSHTKTSSKNANILLQNVCFDLIQKLFEEK